MDKQQTRGYERFISLTGPTDLNQKRWERQNECKELQDQRLCDRIAALARRESGEIKQGDGSGP